jgi:hypothetical protein
MQAVITVRFRRHSLCPPPLSSRLTYYIRLELISSGAEPPSLEAKSRLSRRRSPRRRASACNATFSYRQVSSPNRRFRLGRSRLRAAACLAVRRARRVPNRQSQIVNAQINRTIVNRPITQ